MTRTVTGTEHWPPDMKRYFGSWLTIASPAVGRKSANMISTIGRIPTRLIPSATPTNPFSQIGVVRTRAGPKLLDEPGVGLEDAAVGADVLAQQRTAGSAAIASSSAALIASR